MRVKLAAVEGPLSGETFHSSGKDVSFGRGNDNVVQIDDSALSRQHCVIQVDADGTAMVVDLNSRNGTRVNNIAVEKHALRHGDRIGIGLSEFRISFDGLLPPRSVRLEDDELRAEMTVTLEANESLYLDPVKVQEAADNNAKVTTNLSVLLKMSGAIAATRGANALLEELGGLLLEAIPAQRCVIVSARGRSLDEDSIILRHRSGHEDQPARISRTVLDRVVKENVAVLCRDVGEDRELELAESVVMSQVRSLVCAPLNVAGRRLGIVYLDTRDATVQFDTDDLQLLTTVCGFTAAGLENARYLDLNQVRSL